MCRKTLEGICSAHGVRERNLVSSLRKMRDKSIIDERIHDWSDALRLAGNEAAHDVGVTISQEDARDMLDFANAILDYLFSFRQKFEEFQQTVVGWVVHDLRNRDGRQSDGVDLLADLTPDVPF